MPDSFSVDTTRVDPANSHGHKHLGVALALISAAQLMVVLDATIVNIALPFVKKDLGFSDSNLTWMLNAYTLAFGGLLLLGGRIGDVIGRRKVFTIGVVVFAVASLLGGVAQNESTMLAARVLQGIGAAAASPTALALITTTFPAGPQRNRAFAVYAAMSGAGAAVGLILGGALTEIDWRWTFFINVPIGLGVAFFAPRILAEAPRQTGRFDIPGAVTATVGLVGIVFGLTHKSARGATWTEPQTIVPLVGGLVLVAVFLMIESRSKHALMPLRILASRTRAVSFVAMLVVGAAMFSMFYFLGLYIQVYLGYSSLKTGFAFLPFSLGIVIAAQVASMLMSRVDPRWLAGTGAVLAPIGMWTFSTMDATANRAGNVESSYLTHILPGILVLSFGMGLIFVPLTLTAVSGVAKEDSGVGSAVLNTMQQVGGALGLAVLGTVAAGAANDRAAELAPAIARSGLPADKVNAMAGFLAQPTGYVEAFGIAAWMILSMAVVIAIGLNVRHEEIASDGAPAVHVG